MFRAEIRKISEFFIKKFPFFGGKFKWELFNEALQKHEIKSKLEAISMSPIGDESDINSVVTNFKETLLTALKVSLKQRKISKSNNINRRKWFKSDLYKMRKTLDYKGKLLAKYPSDPHVRGNFYK